MQTPATPVDAAWRVRLLGGVELVSGDLRIERLPSRPVACLLARLALWPARQHAREELVELLWPGVELSIGRNRLRQGLSTLKSLLEPPGASVVLVADRTSIRVVPGALGCDAREFENLLRGGRLQEAAALYGGELMPGHYDEWVLEERARLATLAERTGSPPSQPVLPRASAPRALPPSVAQPQRPLLPSYVTRLFGADAQTRRLTEVVRSHRLVTLHGPGGTGKTRLAVEVAHALLGPAADGPAGPHVHRFDLLAFVPLVACTDAAQLLSAIGASLRSPRAAGDTVDRLVNLLGDLTAVLVLDNFEQLVDAGAPVLAELLARMPTLHLLVTSRRALGIDGEREVPVDPLPVPAADSPVATAADNPAVALFVDRARAARLDFHLGPRNAAAIVALVRNLHGMPLAIELAASRVRSFPPQDILALLQAPGGPGSLDLLSRSGPRSALDPRHASMRKTIEWSWQLLSEDQRLMLQALTVFEGAFGVAAVAAVCGAESPGSVAAALDDLARHSLIRMLPGEADGTARFALYEPIRDFAAAFVTPERAIDLRHALRCWLLAWARKLGPAAPSLVEAELPNVRAALRSAVPDGASLDALRLAIALRSHWDTDGMSVGQVQEIESALADLESQTADEGPTGLLRSDLHELLAYLRYEAGCADEAAAHADAALRWAADDPSRRARALVRRAWLDIVSYRGGPAQQRSLDEALAMAEACGDLEAQARALHQLAVLRSNHAGDPAGAELLLARAQALWEQLGERTKVYARLRNRAQCWAAMGRRSEALGSFEMCEAAAAESGDWLGQIDASLSRGSVLADLRRWPESAVALARCTALCWERHQVHGMSYALWNQARVLARLRQPEAAGRLMAFAEHFWASRLGAMGSADLAYMRRVRGLVKAQVGAARADALWVEGRLLSLPQAVTLARAVPP